MKFILLICLISSLAQAKTELLVLGGGGEPSKPTTLFDDGLKALGHYAKAPDVHVVSYFNGGHSTTERIAQQNFGVNHPFTAENFNSVIADYAKKIQNGQIKDKLLIYVNTHGASRSPNIETTHGIATTGNVVTNFNSFSGPSVVSMDSFKNLVRLAAKKHVKLAIIDLSCHSGNSLELANANTCVISATGPNHYAGAGSRSFATLLSQGLQKGKTLEQVFLEARDGFVDPSFPMISSPAGRDVQNRLYAPITPYLYYYSPPSDKFAPYMESIVSCEKCHLVDGFQALMDEANSVLRLTKDGSIDDSVRKFKSAVENYYRYLDDLELKMKTVGLDQLGRNYKFCSGRECITYSVKQLMTMNFPNLISYYSSQVASSSGADRATNQGYLECAKEAMAKRQTLLAQNPRLQHAANFWESLSTLQTETSILQNKVTSSQRELYEVLYQYSKATGPNPCRDFVL